jgi:2-amino-4-hydroxy-6-hydroxymethyldihydropteridine diphosphokinase
VLDCDIVLWSGGVWRSGGRTMPLAIPHPAFAIRAFVLTPALAIAPGWRDPVSGLTLAHLHARLTRRRPLPRGAPFAHSRGA